jgi:thioesterase domain-containing protein
MKASRHLKYCMPIKTGGNHPPLFCIHGEPLKFAMLLKADRPVYGLCYAYHNYRRSEMPKTLTDYADIYIEELKIIQPKGPYFLCGYSAGGLIAYEMARKLLAEGEKIGDLMLVEPTIYFIGANVFRGAVKHLNKNLPSIKNFFYYLPRLPRYIWRKSEKYLRQALTRLSLKLNLHPAEVLRMPGFLMMLKPLMRNYIYEPIDTSANMIYVNMEQDELEAMQNHWSQLLNNPKIYTMNGVRKHLDLMEEPALSETIALLDKSVQVQA